MVNIKHEIKGSKLIIEVDLNQRHGPSSSGKTEIIASTQGNAQLGSGIAFGLNVFAKPGAVTPK